MAVRLRRAAAILASVTSSGLALRRRGRLVVGASRAGAWLIGCDGVGGRECVGREGVGE